MRRAPAIGMLGVLAGFALSLPAAENARAASAIDFSRQIRPILADHCFACHGPDDGARKAKLRFDTKDGAFKGGESGKPAIVPGQLGEGELIRRITTTDTDDLMPPPKSKKTLSPAQVDLLKRWVAEGASWQTHWSFEKPVRPPLPQVQQASWPRSDLDRFVLARLEKENLKPSPEADKTTLIRRVTLDLTGLPPTLEEVDAFLTDRSPDAYEKVVDRLLASPRYGEHSARYWLDAVRYADSHGYHIDAQRDIWPYREWVIQAFNDNMPFDRFTTEQLAGDLLPNATTAQKIASGYVRCNMSSGEGGAIDAEYQAKYTFDRMETTGAIWMGLTLTCARCHTHKFDPIAHREYYGLYSFFNNLNEPVMDGNKPNPDPFIVLPTTEQTERQAELKRIIGEGQKKIDLPVPELDEAQLAWQTEWRARLASNWVSLAANEAKSSITSGANLKRLDDETILVETPKPSQEVYEITAKLSAGLLGAIRLEALPHNSLPEKGSGRANDGRFRLAEIEAELIVPQSEGNTNKPPKLKFAQAAADHAEAKYEAAKAIDGNADTSWGIATNAVTEPHTAIFVLTEPAQVPAEAELRVRLRFEAGPRALGYFRLAAAQDEALVKQLIPPKQEPWQVIGPFKTESLQAGFEKAFEPEKEIDLKKKYPGVRDELKWSARGELVDGGRHPLVHELHGVHGAYFFYRVIRMAEARRVEFSLQADDLFKVWVNNQLVLEQSVLAKPGAGPAGASVRLNKGENRVLIKVVNHQGAAYFAFDKDLGERDVLPADVAPIIAAAAKPADADVAKVRNHYRREFSAEYKQVFAEMDRWRTEQSALEKAIPTTLVAKEREKPRETFLLMRGEYDKPDEKIAPGVPAILPPWPSDAPTNRLGFARWLLSPDHPLTARVTVNRVWQQYFGVGLVKTTEDFGIQGERPSHPDLLDWLATEFIEPSGPVPSLPGSKVASGNDLESGPSFNDVTLPPFNSSTRWNLKRLHRLMLTSATYRQSSRLAPELLQRDPENRFLARGPRFRVDAEVVRDLALSVGGLLVEKIGGRSVKPYEPPGLWEAISFNNSQKYVPETGEGQYRRSLYTYWKRQSPPPNMLIFDAPTREFCVLRRPRTNTPLQALALLNDPQFVEASRAFAQRILLEGGGSVESRINFAFRLATARKPDAEELKVLREAFELQLAEYQRDREAAEKILGIGNFKSNPTLDKSELAAWTTIASMILNLDETVTKG